MYRFCQRFSHTRFISNSFFFTFFIIEQETIFTANLSLFMSLRSKIAGLNVFVLSVILSFCYSVNLSKTETLLITIEQWKLELWYFTWVFMRGEHSMGTNIVYFITLTLASAGLYEYFNLVNNIWVREIGYFTSIFLVLHVRSLCWYLIFWPSHLTNLKKIDINHKFWSLNDKFIKTLHIVS